MIVVPVGDCEVSILPVVNAFLSPLLPLLTALSEIMIELLYDVLNPFYEITLQIAEVSLTLLDALSPLFDMLRMISDMLGDFLYPFIAAVGNALVVLMEPLKMVFAIINAALVPIFNVLAPLLDAVATGFITVYAVVNVAVNFVIDSLKWIAGWIMSGITDFINGIIDLINKIPFVNIGKINNSKFHEWKNTDVFGNAEDNWKEAIGLLDSINKECMDMGDYMEKDDVDFSDFTKMFEAGYLTAAEYNALVADKLGKEYVTPDNVIADANNYIENDGGTYISFGEVTIRVEGSSDPSATAKAVMKEMERLARSGRGTFDYAV